ncbi:MAG: amylosucrase [Clostridiales bacterium]|jgi:amylosucrase|nr:amylosucrase [Clostridiales bacterium]
MRKKSKRKAVQKRPNSASPAAAKPNQINATAPETVPAVEKETVPAAAESAAVKAASIEEIATPSVSNVDKPEQSQLKEVKPEPTQLMENKPQDTKLMEKKPEPTKLIETKQEETQLANAKTEPAGLIKTEEKKPESDAVKTESKDPAQKAATRTSRTKKAGETTQEPAEKTAKKPAARKSRTAAANKEGATTVQKTTRSKTAKAAKDAKDQAPAKTTRKRAAAKPAVDEEAEFTARFQSHLDEFKWLYMELYNNERLFDELNFNLKEIYKVRKASLKALDRVREADPEWYRRGDRLAMQLDTGLFAGTLSGIKEKLSYLKDLKVNHLHLTPLLKTPVHNSDDGYTISDFRAVREDLGDTQQLEALTDACHKKNISLAIDFSVNHTSAEHEWARRALQGDSEYAARYINHWDLNYRNPVVFNEMVYNVLFLANLGVDAIQLHDLNLLNTRSHSFPKVHSLTRMLRMICDIVCPGVLLECTTGMTPQEAQSFLGTPEKPECHVLYNSLITSSVWNSLATRDIRLLKGELDNLPQGATYLNALRTYDPLRWEMSDDPLSWLGFDPYLHREFLFDFYDGSYSGSFAKGAQYHNYEDDGSCGTTASLCGIEKALENKDDTDLDLAVSRDLMMHTFLLTLPGIPTLYSGDEVGQLNQTIALEADTRLTYRAPFDWSLAEQRTDASTVAGKLFQHLRSIQTARAKYAHLFSENVPYTTVDCGDISILSIVRVQELGTLNALFNFCEEERAVTVEPGAYTDLLTGKKSKGGEIILAPYQAMWLYRKS